MKQILVIEDTPVIRKQIAAPLNMQGFNVIEAENGAIGVQLAQKHLPSLIVCDIVMPELDGYGVLEALRKNPATANIPFIFLTGKAEKADIRQGMALGADDYLSKPFTPTELLDAVHSRLKRSAGMEHYENKIKELSEIVNQQKQPMLMPWVQVVSGIIEASDKFYYSPHGKGVAIIAHAVAEMMNVATNALSDLVVAALLHDIGKIGMNNNQIALEPDKMSPADLGVYKKHVENAVKLLNPIGGFDRVRTIIAQHHENYDGSGFPAGLTGKQISLEAQILSIANVYHNKVYKIPLAHIPTSGNLPGLSQSAEEQARRHKAAMVFLRVKAGWFNLEASNAFAELVKSGKCPAICSVSAH
jgi:putative nucleotidyltransferase with HDIG domain